MSERDSDFYDFRAVSLQRLAALQRLREQAVKGKRDAMLETIDKLLEQETRALRERDLDDEPA